MAYTKNTWNDGDVITKEKMNNLETGVETANQGIPVTATTAKAGIVKQAATVAEAAGENVTAAEFFQFTTSQGGRHYVANLVADRIFKYMVDNPEIRKRIYCAIDKAEKSIVSTIVKKEGQVNRVGDDLISRRALREEVKKYRDGNFSSTDRTSYALSYVIGLINNQPTAFEIMKKPERGNENGQEEINTR